MQLHVSDRARRRGLTLIELLIVVVIIAILLGLLLFGVQAARESARRTQCLANVQQIALGTQNYTSANGHFPFGEHNKTGRFRFNDWLTHILPFVGQEAIYSKIIFHYYKGGIQDSLGYAQPDATFLKDFYGVPELQNNVLQSTHIPLYACPSQPDMPMLVHCCAALPWPALGADDRAAVSYCAISTHVWDSDQDVKPNASGVIFTASRTPVADVQDGLSNTLLMAEVYENYDDVKKERYWTIGGNGPGVPAAVGEQYCPRGRCNLGPGWSFGALTTTFHGINRRVKYDAANSAWITTSNFGTINSFHPGGAVFGVADGSARFIADSIPTEVLQSLGTRKPGMFPGEQVVSGDAW